MQRGESLVARAAADRRRRVRRVRIEPRNAYMMNSLLQSVAQRPARARGTNVLNRTGPAGQDRHDQRFAQGRLVRRLSAHARRHRVDRLRQSAQSRRQGNRRRPRVAGLDRVHGERAQRRAGVQDADAGRRRPNSAQNCISTTSRRGTVSSRQWASVRPRWMPRRAAQHGRPRPEQVGEQEKQDIMNLFRGH